MLEIVERVEGHETELTLILPFEGRQRSRRRVVLSSGESALLLTPRGVLLRGGEVFTLSDGRFVRVVSAPEAVSTVRAADPLKLTRAAYHLGNRHVPLQVGEGFVRYQQDHVLDDMVRELGLEVLSEDAPFEPEGGAYAGQQGEGHSHSHAHSHGPGHSHAHSHGHSHSHSHGDAHEHAHVRNYVTLGDAGEGKPKS